MKLYTVKLMNGDKTNVTEEEYVKMAGKSGLVYVPSTKETINMSSISHILPAEEAEDRSKQKYGILHDGTRVIRQFGEWVDADSPIDERGHHTVRLDPQYYPETVRDSVPTPEEFERDLRHLPPSERLAKMLVSPQRTARTFQKITYAELTSRTDHESDNHG